MQNVVAHVIPNNTDVTFGESDKRKLNSIKFENVEIVFVEEYTIKEQANERKSGSIIKG